MPNSGWLFEAFARLEGPGMWSVGRASTAVMVLVMIALPFAPGGIDRGAIGGVTTGGRPFCASGIATAVRKEEPARCRDLSLSGVLVPTAQIYGVHRQLSTIAIGRVMLNACH